MNIGKNILLVDDHLVVRKGILMIFKTNYPNVTVYEAEDYGQALEVLKVVNIDLILLDININGNENIKIMNDITSLQADTKILIFSSHDENQYGLRYIQNGAHGFLNKFCSEEILLNAISEVFVKGHFYSDEIQNKIKSSKPNAKISTDNLSNREFEIAQLLLNGYGNLEISNKLNLQMSTVSTYKNRLFEKLNVSSVVAMSELFKSEKN